LDLKTVPNTLKQRKRTWIAASQYLLLYGGSYLEEAATWRRQLPGGGSYPEEPATWRRQLPGESSHLEEADTWRNHPGKFVTWGRIVT
jgi:hypothetical protein